MWAFAPKSFDGKRASGDALWPTWRGVDGRRGAGGRATGGNMAELAGLQEKLPRHTLGGVRAVLSAPMFRLFSLPFLLGTAMHACFTIWFS